LVFCSPTLHFLTFPFPTASPARREEERVAIPLLL
jgi:hypothetical protein